MRQWRTFLKVLYGVLRPIDPSVKLDYQPPVDDESSSVDVKLNPETDVDVALSALKKIEPDWGFQTDSETNLKDSTFRINVENDFKRK